MTASTGPGPNAKPSSRRIVRSLLRATGSTVALVVIYYLLPLDQSSTLRAVTILVIGLVVFIGLIAFQIRSIIRSQFPGLRAIEALATSVPLYLLLFASAYVVMAAISRSSFGVPLTHTDALYFTVTVFSTVGFGDITAKTETARLVVTTQILADLLVIGLGLRAILGAVTRSRQQRPLDAGTEPPGE
jgi:voltage-gated potassium channel